jgi:hypothetical protein
VRVPAALIALTVAGALLCVGCAAAVGSSDGREWHANAAGFVAQLRDDIATARTVAPTLPEAARALASTSDLFALLIAYSDLAGCSAMASATAAPPNAVRELSAPCPLLERAAGLFTRAQARHDPALLLAATRIASRAEPLLVRAAVVARRR